MNDLFKGCCVLLFIQIFSFGAAFAANTSAINVSREYGQVRKFVEMNHFIDREFFGQYRLMFITGFFNKIMPHLVDYFRTIGIEFPQAVYDSFADQKRYFSDYGIEFVDIPINSLGNLDVNSEVIENEIRRSDKRIIFITYSKGGLDLLHTLVKHRDLEEKVAGWVALQSPFAGTPLADLFEKTPLVQGLTKYLLKVFQGNSDVVKTLIVDERRDYLAKNFSVIRDIISAIPFLCLGSWENYGPNDSYERALEEGLFSRLSILTATIPYIKSKAGFNDGFVPLDSSILPGGDYVVLKGIDHAGLVMDVPPFKSLGFDERMVITRSLLYMIKKRIEDRAF